MLPLLHRVVVADLTGVRSLGVAGPTAVAMPHHDRFVRRAIDTTCDDHRTRVQRRPRTTGVVFLTHPTNTTGTTTPER